MNTGELILYSGTQFSELMEDALWLGANYREESISKEVKRNRLHAFAGSLLKIADEYGLEGDLWSGFLALWAVMDENPFTTSCEVRGDIKGSLGRLALKDCGFLYRLLHLPLDMIGEEAGTDICLVLRNFDNGGAAGKVFDKNIRKGILDLGVRLSNAKTAEEIYQLLTGFYGSFGVGKLGLHKAFRVVSEGEETVIEAIPNVEEILLSDLVGYERQKAKLLANTEAFIEGRAANNVLLFGDSGTGKSSSIKAILNQFYPRGLRMIEVYKHQFQNLSDVIGQIKDRNYKFIIYMDDLSFEDFELEYKYLKAIIEGGLGKKPDNVLIYATSNRRHLIREKFSDKRQLSDELHNNDTVQEKLSLSARFGVTIYFGSPDKKEFQNIVSLLAERHDIHMDEAELLELANQWELTHGGLSGRTASQFITHLLGK